MTISTDRSSEPLAIVGMACRLPGAANLKEYWKLIVEGRSAVAEVPPDRLNAQLYFDPQRGVRGKTYSKKAALLADRNFDAANCPIPEELRDRVDNTHLLMTGVAADALRHAGLDPFQLPDRNTAVFIGHAQGSNRLGELIFSTYLDDALEILESIDGFREMPGDEQQRIQRELAEQLRSHHSPDSGGARDLNCNMVSGTIAKAFGLTGPWLALNSACASSLHAMLLGARALQRGRADMAIVGGASDCKCDSLVLFSNAQAMSAEATRPFDANADGLIMSEGYVALVMKTLKRAVADGDPIQAVIRGLGVATDGRGKSLWAPRKEGQMKAMLRAYRSGADISRLQYLECHATATQLGDATELTTLGEVLGSEFTAGKRIPITSVKANIGHSLEAAGMAGLIKTVLCMQHKTVPPAINIESLNPKVDWDAAPYYVPMQPEAWQSPPDGGPRSAAVNAFGIGGLNMHVVVDEYTEATPATIRSSDPPPAENMDDQSVAVVGMSCVFPGAKSLDEYWSLLLGGLDPKSVPPEDRWSQRGMARMNRQDISPIGGFIREYAYDWRKHKVPPKQIAEADPLQFMLLDASEQAIEDAGYSRKSIDGEKCGVVVGTEFGGDFGDHLEMGLRLPEIEHFLGQALQRRGFATEQVEQIKRDYADKLLKKWPSLVDETGSFTSSTLASRISKTLDLAGGAVSVDSGATSAMNAISICVDMLQSGDNDLMICAAGQRRMASFTFDHMLRSGLLTHHAAPRSVVDAIYDGVVPGEGVGAIVLKRLSDARRDGDRIHAIIRGIGVGHAESLSEAARLATQRSCAMAGVQPDDIGFLELDTDEPLGPSAQPLRALAETHAGLSRKNGLAMTSVCDQIGHLGGGAAMASLIKASLEVEQRQLPATFSVGQANSVLPADRVTPVAATAPLEGRGLGAIVSWSRGQVWHLIVEQATATPVVDPRERTIAAGASTPTGTPAADIVATNSPLTLSAALPLSGAPASARIVRLGAESMSQLGDVAGKAAGDVASLFEAAESLRFDPAHPVRLAVVAASVQHLERKLKLAASQLGNPASRQVLDQQGVFARELTVTRPRVVFTFPGQGSQYDGMLQQLVGELPAAARELERVDTAMTDLGFPTFAELAWAATTQLGNDVWSTQISLLLADTICLASLRDLGIEPDLVLGHSYGEFVALYAAGVWDFETAIRMTRARCDGIVSMASGDAGMLATDAPVDDAKRLIASSSARAYLANLNAPDQTVIAGKHAHLDVLSTSLLAESFQARVLPVPAAFHTPLMAGASRLLVQALQTATLSEPRVPVISTVDNRRMETVDHIRRNLGGQLTTPVQYAPLIGRLAAEAPTVFIEVGPHQTLTKLNRRIVDAQTSVIACDNAKRAGLEPLLCVQALLECLGVLDGPPVVVAAGAESSTKLKGELEEILMDDQIPHFDATQRRREKMRSASARELVADKANGNGAAPGVATPAPAAVPVSHGHRGAALPEPLPPERGTPSPKNMHVSPAAPPPPPPVPAAPPVSTRAAATVPDTDWESFLVNFVVEQTGYPPEVVELDADLEADLGIDSIKKAQLFGELQEYFDIGSMEASELSLDDFPTLRHVLNLLNQGGGSAATADLPEVAVQPSTVAAPVSESPLPPQRAVAVEEPFAGLPSAHATVAAPHAAEMESFLINFVVEQTGYPPEVVEMDADLEADLGIDSIKKAQLFGELQEYFDVSSLSGAGELSLDDFPTLRHVLEFLIAGASSPTDSAQFAVEPPAAAPVSPTAAPQVSSPLATREAPVTAQAPVVGAEEMESFLINFVVEQTGYPPEVVELDADLEADLGIDSIKKAQLFGELQEYFDVGSLSESTELSLDDFPTLRHVLNFLAAGAKPGASVPAGNGSPFTPNFPSAEPAPAMETTSESAPAAVNENAAELESFLINFVVEQTGYPAEVVELDADLEADLGIDSIKKAQLFGELQEYFDVGSLSTETELSLDDFPTLRHVLDFLSSATSAGDTVSDTTHSSASEANAADAASLSNVSVTVVEGTPYEMGAAQGRQFGDRIRSNLQRYVECTDHALEDLPGQFAEWASPEQVLSADELDELQGMADAAELPLGNVVTHDLAVSAEIGSDAGHVAILARANRTGRLVHAMRQPLPSLGALRESVEPAVLVRKPIRGIAYAAVCYIGSTRFLGGVNAAGVGITTFPLQVGSRETNRRAASSVARRVLQHAADLEAAIRLLHESVTGEAWSACISDVHADRLAFVEFDGQHLHVSTDEDRVIAGRIEPVPSEQHAWTVDTLTGHIGDSSSTANVESNEVVFAIDAAAGELLIHGAGLSLQRIPVSRLLPEYAQQSRSDHDLALPTPTPPTALPESCVTTRFVLEMHAAPLSGQVPVNPTWHGPAIILGDNRTAQTLGQRLRQAGVDVFPILPGTSIEDASAQVQQICDRQAAPHLFITTPRDVLPASPDHEAQWNQQRHANMMLPFFVCQKWLEIASSAGWIDQCTLVATTAEGGGFGFERGAEVAQGGALSGLLKAIFIEYAVMQGRKLRVKTIDSPDSMEADALVQEVFREIASGNLDYEVGFINGRRRVPFAVEQSAPVSRARIRRGSTWVVTGGARGITAACALELGRQYELKLHLIGSSPLPGTDPSMCNLNEQELQQLRARTMIAARKAGQPAVKAWTDLQRNLEIGQSLTAFHAAGIEVTYHACDVSDRAALAQTLERVRETDGPIAGILHGAGIDRSCRYERKRDADVRETIGAKVDGAAHLMALTRRDPVRHFIGFGSISGRLGSFGQTDYCLASDMLCKLIGAYRRDRPWIQAVGFHWHPWDGVGMAARPETKSVLQDQSQLELMPLREGIAHLLREIESGTPECEVLITERRHWNRFAEGLGTFAADTQVETDEPSAAASRSPDDEAAMEPRTHRCVMRMQPAPLTGVSAAMSFRGPVWILGDNEVATALERRLQESGATVRRLPVSDDIDQVLSRLQELWDVEPSRHLFLLTGRDAVETDLTTEDAMSTRQTRGVMLPFFVAQLWYKLLRKNEDLRQATLTSVVSLGGDFGFGGRAVVPDGGALSGLLKAVHIEDSRRDDRRLRCKVIDAPADDAAELITGSVLKELAAVEPEVEVSWAQGRRAVVRPIPESSSTRQVADRKSPQGGTWVITGGARGITAIAARELARRYGWRIHLLGASPPPEPMAIWRDYGEVEMKALKTSMARQAVAERRSPSEAWDRVMKDVEIFGNLRQFAEAGVSATYHTCDVSDRAALKVTLERIREHDGPIRGILHGAGMIDPGRFESKRRNFVHRLINAKYRGLLNLIALCQSDPLDFCIGFGSISGRFGGNGLTDYAAGNDVMAKLIDWIRLSRPACAAATIHWESWEGSGMATLPRYAWGPKAIMNMKYMTPEEGVQRLKEELEAGLPDSEVLYTFGDFYSMFYPDEQFRLGEFTPDLPIADADESHDRPLVKSIREVDGGWIGDVPLDPQTEAFLLQHRLRNKPLLPVVVGLEAMAEIAQAASGRKVTGFNGVRMLDGLTFHTDKPVTAQVRAEDVHGNSMECRLSCDFRNRAGRLIHKDRLYLQAGVELADEPLAPETKAVRPPGEWTPFSYPDGADVYHGPAFRGVNGVRFERAGGWGRMTSLPIADLVTEARADGWLVPSCVLDAAFYTCGIHLWMYGDQAVSLPRQIDRLRLGRSPRTGETCLTYCVCREITAKAARYDFAVFGEDRSLILEAEGYDKVILGRGGNAK